MLVTEATNYDYYRSEWDFTKNEWGKPEPVEEWNTDDQEWGLWVSEDDSTAYLAGKVHGGVEPVGGRDIWISREMQRQVGNATNLGEPINSEANEWSPFVDKVGRIYFDSNREGSIGDYSIWVTEHAQGTPEVFDVIASGASEREITMNDKFLIFSADKREGGFGGYDLWISVFQDASSSEEGVSTSAAPITLVQPTPSTASPGLTVDYYLNGSMTLSFHERNYIASVRYKPFIDGSIIIKGEPFPGLNGYVRLRHKNSLSGNADENWVRVDKYVASLPLKAWDTEMTGRLFWNEDIKSFEEPFGILNAKKVRDNSQTPDKVIGGGDLTVNAPYGIQGYGFVVPRYIRTGWAALMGYEVSADVLDQATLRYSLAQFNRSLEATSAKLNWRVLSADVTPMDNLDLTLGWANLSQDRYDSTPEDDESANAYYLTSTYKFGPGSVRLGWKTADEDFRHDSYTNDKFTAVPIGVVEDKFPAGRKGIEFGASYDVMDDVTLGYSGDYTTTLEGEDAVRKHTLTAEGKMNDVDVDTKLTLDSSAAGVGKTLEVTADYKPQAIKAGLKYDAPVNDDTVTTLQAELDTFDRFNIKLGFSTFRTTLRGEVNYDVTNDTMVGVVLKTRSGETAEDDRQNYRFLKLERTFNSSNKLYVHYGIDDEGKLDKGWYKDTDAASKYLKVGFNMKF